MALLWSSDVNRNIGKASLEETGLGCDIHYCGRIHDALISLEGLFFFEEPMQRANLEYES
jgi:hypothetical protein